MRPWLFTLGTMLYHFSEDPTIRRFVPHVPQYRQGEVEPLVWAIDWWHQPMYFFPRECPRILLWPIASTSEQDLQRWFDGSEARMVAFIERDWLARMRDARLYRYTFAGDEFEDLSDAGMWVSRAVVIPIRVEPVGTCSRRRAMRRSNCAC